MSTPSRAGVRVHSLGIRVIIGFMPWVGTCSLLLCSRHVSHVLDAHVNGIIYHFILFLISFSHHYLCRFIHIVAHNSNSFSYCFIVLQYVTIPTILFIHSMIWWIFGSLPVNDYYMWLLYEWLLWNFLVNNYALTSFGIYTYKSNYWVYDVLVCLYLMGTSKPFPK